MPLSKDELGGGTEADGSRSTEYCCHCYPSGQFTQPALTAAEMVASVRHKLQSTGLPRFLARSMTKGIPYLRRWTQTPPSSPATANSAPAHGAPVS